MKRAILALPALLLACGGPTGPVSGGLAVRAASPILALTNESSAPVYSFIIERGAAAYTDWAPCTDPTRCAAIKVGQTASVPYAQIVSYTAGAREAIVYWWHLIPDAETTLRADSIRAVVVGL